MTLTTLEMVRTSSKCIQSIYDRDEMERINYGRFRDDKSKSAPCR